MKKLFIKIHQIILLFSFVMPLSGLADDTHRGAVISLIIDDIGNNPETGKAALDLPGDLVISILPNTPYAASLAKAAFDKGKQVMLHLPMESQHRKRLGPNGLRLKMQEHEFKQTVNLALSAVPYVVGLNNHMGSLLTQHKQPMQWLMDVLRDRELFFLDSRTTIQTVAQQTAADMCVKNFKRDVFLDNSRKEEDIESQFHRLIKIAQRRGYATGIGHPYPETISVLQRLLPQLEQHGVKLVFATDLVNKYVNKPLTQVRSTAWVESSSPSHKVAKNSKL